MIKDPTYLTLCEKALYLLVGLGQNLIIYGFVNLLPAISESRFGGTQQFHQHFFTIFNLMFLICIVLSMYIGVNKRNIVVGSLFCAFGILSFLLLYVVENIRAAHQLMLLFAFLSGTGSGLVQSSLYALAAKNNLAVRLISLMQSSGGLINILMVIALKHFSAAMGLTKQFHVAISMGILTIGYFTSNILFLSFSPYVATAEEWQTLQKNAINADLENPLIAEETVGLVDEKEKDFNGFNFESIFYLCFNFVLQFCKSLVFPAIGPMRWGTRKTLIMFLSYQVFDMGGKLLHNLYPVRIALQITSLYIAAIINALLFVMISLSRKSFLSNELLMVATIAGLGFINNYGSEAGYSKLMRCLPERLHESFSLYNLIATLLGLNAGSMVSSFFLLPFIDRVLLK